MTDVPKKAMVIMAHPDDAEFGCAGTVAKWAKAGAEVVYVICTNGDKGSSDPQMTPPRIAAIREQEQRNACKTLGVKEVVFLGHPDGELEDNREFRGELVREIRRFRPEAVVCPDPSRRSFFNHRDHRICGQVALDAVYPYSRDRLHFSELLAQGFQPHKVNTVFLQGPDEPDTYVDISDTIDLKLKALLCHVSQVSNPGRDIEKSLRENAQRIGEKGGVPYAEAFRKIEIWR